MEHIEIKRDRINSNRILLKSKSYRVDGPRYFPYMLIAPWFILFLVFTVYPIIFSAYVSLTDFNMLNPDSLKTFVGLSNFKELFTDPYFFKAVKVTLIFTFGTIPITTVLSCLLGVALSKNIPYKTVFRVGFFLPTVTSVAVISTLFQFIFNRKGIFSKLMELFGMEAKSWLLDERFALPSIMLMSIWGAFGFYTIIYLAAIKSIPEEIYEAATVDGAKPIQKFFYITVPYLRHTTIYVLVMNSINSLQVFSEPYIMTQGGPAGATTTGVYYLYLQGFTSQRMGYASAIGYGLFFIMLIFSLLQIKVLGLNKGVDE